MRKKVGMALGCALELVGGALIIFTRFSHPALTETQLLLSCWPTFGIATLLVVAGLTLAGVWRR